MACPRTLCLLLLLPLTWSQQDGHAHPAPGAQPAHIGDLLRSQDASLLDPKQTYAQVQKDHEKLGLFIAAALGTVTLMAAVYCIYNKFYTKHQYLHTQLEDDNELTLDSVERQPPVYFHGSVGSMGSMGYGSLSDTPSIIAVPPSLSPPPSSMPFPPLFLSAPSLRTISAKDLEKSFL